MEKQNNDLLDNLFTSMKDLGFVRGTEQFEICFRAVQYMNFHYKRSEELEDNKTVDCSTLVSQSYWEGAAIGIPFIADSQRTATTGKTILSRDDLIPSDVIIKYSSLEASPDKTWNHVGLYLGRDHLGIQWLIESASKTGVVLSKVDEFNPQGGMKRFTLSTHIFDQQLSFGALSLTKLVPKFGRLGVRQYTKQENLRLPHKGIDLYEKAGTKVYATIEGLATRIYSSVEDAHGIQIVGADLILRYFMLDKIEVNDNEYVKIGDCLGIIANPSPESQIIYSTAQNVSSHLHIEVERTGNIGGSGVIIDGKEYLNHLYLSKMQILELPFRI